MSSKAWKTRQQNDPYVRRAREEGYRARAAYKLLELDQKDSLFGNVNTVVDLGAAPGSWSQVARQRLGDRGRVVALDILPMEPLPGVVFIQADFREDSALAELERLLEGGKVDLVLSDMAPNISGIGPADQARSVHLAELALAFAQEWLDTSGSCVVKVFQGAGFDSLLTNFRRTFKSTKVRKPAASRAQSREVYLVGRGLTRFIRPAGSRTIEAAVEKNPFGEDC
ncbi:MAG: RlmE family RNA methyltransferase [Wenzhouxiangella sp.]|nr:MAG: RlmE family RNA methyltransferase [Wenzhouxiangella sp.]